MKDNQGVTPSGPGSRASHDDSKLSSPKASIPNAAWLIDRYRGPVDLSERGAGFIEGYAAGLACLTHALIGEPDAGKSYDPMTVQLERGTMASYVFNMKDGGRVHPLSQYGSYQEIADELLLEALETLSTEPEDVHNALYRLRPAINEKLTERDLNRPCNWCGEVGCQCEEKAA